MKEPRRRSWLRMNTGQLYFSVKRILQSYLSDIRYAREQSDSYDPVTLYPHVVFQHRTVLMRRLRHVDMWLQQNKVHNLALAIPKLDGLIVRPGETMSYWKLIGRPSKRRGYKQGVELYEGTFRPGYGGGLCQLSNLIYWMTLHTPLTVTERFRHQYDVFPDANRTQPFGSGATCAYNYVDLQIRNETDQTFCLHLYLTDTHLVGEWRTERPLHQWYNVYERSHRFAQQSWGGYTRHNEIWRKVYDQSGEEIADEFITENHALMMYRPLLEAGTGTSEGVV